MGLLRAALAIAIVSLLTSCAAVTPAFVSPSAVTAISQASSASSYYSFMPFFSSFGSAPRWPGDEVRIDAVPVPSAPDHRQYSGVAALESLTHYWGDPADWRGIAAEIAPLEGGDAAITRILACLNRRDYEARLRQATLDSVRDEVRRGRPVLLFLKIEPAFARHFIQVSPVLGYALFGWLPRIHHVLLVVGYDRNDQYFLCHSGNNAYSLWRHDELDQCWARTLHSAIFVMPKGRVDPLTSAH
ncbi:MAG: hypothetical protein ACLQVA_18635 [Candidatus Brocadiia bacterium]